MKEKDELQDKKEEEFSFLSEQIKERPLNKQRLFRRIFYMAVSAVVFVLVANVTFLMIEPAISDWLYPEKINKVSIPVDEEEVSPDELLTEKDAEKEAVEEATQAATQVAKEAAAEAAQSVIKNAQVSIEGGIGIDTYESLYAGLYAVAETVKKSIVEVTGVRTNIDWFQETIENKNSISGIAIAQNGKQILILGDVKHLHGAQKYVVGFYDGTLAEANLSVMDDQTGLGIFTVNRNEMEESTLSELTFAILGNSNRPDVIGRPIIAVGSPLGDFGSVSYGIVNSVGKVLTLSDASYKILTPDIYGTRQASGVLINISGEVLGIITESAKEKSDDGLLCAISISDIKPLIERLSNRDSLTYVGVHGMDVTEVAHRELEIPYGAYVSEVDVESPAMNAGITKGDVIVRAGETEILSFQDYQNTVMQFTPGNLVHFVVARFNGVEYQEMTCDITVQSKGNM